MQPAVRRGLDLGLTTWLKYQAPCTWIHLKVLVLKTWFNTAYKVLRHLGLLWAEKAASGLPLAVTWREVRGCCENDTGDQRHGRLAREIGQK